MYLGQYIDKQNWDNQNNRVKKTHPNYKRLNNFILAKLAEINKSLLDIESDNSPITQIEEIRSKIQNRNKNHSFYEFAEFHFQELERNKKYYNSYTGKKWGSISNYDLCINSATYGIEGTVDIIERMITTR